MLWRTLQCAACALAFAVYASVASAGDIYQDPASEFRTPLPNGWTVEPQATSKELCEDTQIYIRSGRDPITLLAVKTCPVDLDPATMRERYRKSPARGLQGLLDTLAYIQEMMATLRTLSDWRVPISHLKAELDALRQQIDNPEVNLLALRAKLESIDEKIEIEKAKAQLLAEQEGVPWADHPAPTSQLQWRLLEYGCRPFFRGYMSVLSGAGRVETSGKVNRTTALGRDAMRNDFVFYPKKDGKPRRGFAVYLHGDRTSYFFAVTGNDQEYPAAVQMFEATEILK